MSIKLIYSVRDSKAGIFFPPFLQLSESEAIRNFTDVANQKDKGIGLHPEDYCLFYMGTFDDNTGEFCLVSPSSIALASTLVHV